MIGYHNDREATAAKFEDGWLRTGDMATRADDGMVHVLGRMDDVINRGGEKVVPLEVEEALCNHPSIVEAAVVGVPDGHFGSVVVAAVVVRDKFSPGDLDRFLRNALADYKRPRIGVVEQLPAARTTKSFGRHAP
jgi:acyl-coenzyme A synthetase/AMP-(fatty) acid ligase